MHIVLNLLATEDFNAHTRGCRKRFLSSHLFVKRVSGWEIISDHRSDPPLSQTFPGPNLSWSNQVLVRGPLVQDYLRRSENRRPLRTEMTLGCVCATSFLSYSYVAAGMKEILQARWKNHSPDPATPTVAAPAPMNLAAESMSRLAGEVWKDRTWGRRATGFVFWATRAWLWHTTALLNGRR